MTNRLTPECHKTEPWTVIFKMNTRTKKLSMELFCGHCGLFFKQFDCAEVQFDKGMFHVASPYLPGEV